MCYQRKGRVCRQLRGIPRHPLVQYLRARDRMNLRCPNRLSLSRFSFAVFGLALSVFAWGLQYKLSLYDPVQAVSHTIPEAKLLSKDEQAAVTTGSTIADTRMPAELVYLFAAAFVFLLVQILSVFPAERRAEQDHRRPWSVSCAASMNAFFFRPPPASA